MSNMHAVDSKAHYDKEGYAIFRNVLDRELIEEGRSHIDWLLKKYPDKRPEQLTYYLMTNDAFWVRLVSDDRLLDVAEKFVGKNIALYASHYICKPPRTGQAVLWHQDGSYWPLKPMVIVTMWLSFDKVDTENGCLQVIPRTQNLNLEVVQKSNDDNVLESGMNEQMVDETRAVNIKLEPGDVSIHHPNVIHGSHANKSDRWRRGLTIRYMPSSTEILDIDGWETLKELEIEPSEYSVKEKPFPSAFMLRGEVVPGLNLYNPWPLPVDGETMNFKGMDDWALRAEKFNAEIRTQSPK